MRKEEREKKGRYRQKKRKMRNSGKTKFFGARKDIHFLSGSWQTGGTKGREGSGKYFPLVWPQFPAENIS